MLVKDPFDPDTMITYVDNDLTIQGNPTSVSLCIPNLKSRRGLCSGDLMALSKTPGQLHYFTCWLALQVTWGSWVRGCTHSLIPTGIPTRQWNVGSCFCWLVSPHWCSDSPWWLEISSSFLRWHTAGKSWNHTLATHYKKSLYVWNAP